MQLSKRPMKPLRTLSRPRKRLTGSECGAELKAEESQRRGLDTGMDNKKQIELKKPRGLSTKAGELWDTQAKRAEASGYLTRATLPSFIVLCEVYSTMYSIDRKDRLTIGAWAKCTDLYLKLAKPFGLMPSTEAKYDDDSGERDEHGVRQ